MINRAAIFAVCAIACTASTEPIAARLIVDGDRERSAVVSVLLVRGSDTIPASSVTLSFSPADAATRLNGTSVKLLKAGRVTISASSTGASATIDLDVAAPPSFLFDLLVGGNRDIYRAALDGGDVLRLTQDPGDDQRPSWTSTKVTFISYRSGRGAVMGMPPGGGTEAPVEPFPTAVRGVAIAPGGGRYAFTADSAGTTKIYTANIDGTGVARATRGHASFVVESDPSWSPSGDRLVYMSTSRGGADLYFVTPGSTPQLIDASSLQADVEPSWSPDGLRVAFVSTRDGGAQVYVADVATNAVTRVTQETATVGQPTWVSATRIVYTVFVGSSTQVRWIDTRYPGIAHDISLPAGRAEHPSGAR